MQKVDPRMEQKLSSCFKTGVLEAGCDEAGRGCLAGPVVAAAVILPADYSHPVLNDSKKLDEQTRYRLREEIVQCAISWSVAFVDSTEIDRINIYRASMLAMHKAISKLSVIPEHLIIDGNKFIKYGTIPHKCIVKGDSKYFSIAASSVLAKTYRDDFMLNIHNEFSCYAWDRNKGYATISHREAIKIYGLSPYHRRSFRLRDSQLDIEFR